MIEIGNTLREARTRQGLSIHDAEEATKIRTRYLQALEEEDFEVIPGSTFVMGFMRTYASYLGLDEDMLVEEYRNRYDPGFLDAHRLPTARVRPRSARLPTSRSNYVVVAILALIIILVLAWIGWGNQAKSPATMEKPSTTTTRPAGTTALSGAAATDATATVTGATTTGEGAGDAPGGDNQGQGQGELTVVVAAQNDRCYLMVREDSGSGSTLYSQTLNENEEVTFTTDDVLWMNIGNPSAIVLVINGSRHEVPEPYGIFKVTATGLERL